MSSEERLKILKMVADGILTIEDAESLLDVLGEKQAAAQDISHEPGMQNSGRSDKWLRVVVTDIHTGKIKVNLRIPSSLLSAGMKMGKKLVPQIQGLDTAEFFSALNLDVSDNIVDVINEKDGEHVLIMIE